MTTETTEMGLESLIVTHMTSTGWAAGNPPNPDGLKTDYLWKRFLTPTGLTSVLENYAQIVEFNDDKTGKKKRTQIWPRYHQLDVARKLLTHAGQHGVGQRKDQALPELSGGSRSRSIRRGGSSSPDRE